MYFKIVLILAIGSVFGHANGLRDGELYNFASVTDDHVITVALTGSNITIEPWQEGSDQKWLAVHGIMASDTFLLLPKRQVWTWSKFVKDTTKDRLDFLPDGTMVLAEDSTSGSVIQQTFNGNKSQQWKSADQGKGKSIIKNLNDNKCLYNPGPPEQPKESQGFLSKIKNGITGKKKEKIRPTVLLGIKDCNPTDEAQLWIISVVV